jgi:hypothetical protein
MDTNKYFTAIFFDADKKPYKYRNIKNTEKDLQSFVRFAFTKNAKEINFYEKETKNFVKKIKL